MALRKKTEELMTVVELKEVLRKTGEDVRAANFSKGIAMTVVEGDQMVELHPDGTRQVLAHRVAPSVRVSKRRFTLD